jgi:hypothetical protein
MPTGARPCWRLLAALLAVGLVSSAGACPREGTPPPAAPRDIRGTWDWVRSVHRVTGEVHSPATEGLSAELVLTGDPDAGRFEYRRRGAVVASGRFETGWEDEPGNDFVHWYPPFSFHHTMQWLAVGTESMRVEDADTGGYVTTWSRRR